MGGELAVSKVASKVALMVAMAYWTVDLMGVMAEPMADEMVAS